VANKNNVTYIAVLYHQMFLLADTTLSSQYLLLTTLDKVGITHMDSHHVHCMLNATAKMMIIKILSNNLSHYRPGYLITVLSGFQAHVMGHRGHQAAPIYVLVMGHRPK
jgi:hypothetical protein